MRRFQLILHSFLAFILSTSLVYSQSLPNTFSFVNESFIHQNLQFNGSEFYNEVVSLIENLELGEFDENLSFYDLNKMNSLFIFLAKKGVSRYDAHILEQDVKELTGLFDNPVIENHEYPRIGVNHNWFSKSCSKTKSFVKKHKKAIIIGAVVVVAAVVVIAVVASSGGAATAAIPAASGSGGSSGGAAMSGAGAIGAGAIGAITDKSESSDNSSKNTIEIPSIPHPLNSSEFSKEAPLLSSAINQQMSEMQKELAQDKYFPASTPRKLSSEDRGRAIAPIVAHQSFEDISKKIATTPDLSQEVNAIKQQMQKISPHYTSELTPSHETIGQLFHNDQSSLFTNPNLKKDMPSFSYHSIGEEAMARGQYKEAVENFNKFLNIQPSNPDTYLRRSASYFHLGEYENSIRDFKAFADASQQHIEPFHLSEFTKGFVNGFPNGIYESGEGIILFLTDLITHPIHTTSQTISAFSTLAKLIKQDEFGMIAKSLAPEIYELARDWETIPSHRRGELAGYALGKHGMDILAPGALVKAAKNGTRVAREVTQACKTLKLARETLLLETAAAMGNGAKVGEVINAGKTTMFLGDELGFTAKEMGQLKKVGKLESAIDSGLSELASQTESKIVQSAIKNKRHIETAKKSLHMTPNQLRKSIRSFEKQIEKHQKKIENPSKYCPGWNKLHPEYKENLINHKWPKEIKGFKEQVEICEAILRERGL